MCYSACILLASGARVCTSKPLLNSHPPLCCLCTSLTLSSAGFLLRLACTATSSRAFRLLFLSSERMTLALHTPHLSLLFPSWVSSSVHIPLLQTDSHVSFSGVWKTKTEPNKYQTRTTQTDRTMVEEELRTFFSDGWGFKNGRRDYKPDFRVKLRKVGAILSS